MIPSGKKQNPTAEEKKKLFFVQPTTFRIHTTTRCLVLCSVLAQIHCTEQAISASASFGTHRALEPTNICDEREIKKKENSSGERGRERDRETERASESCCATVSKFQLISADAIQIQCARHNGRNERDSLRYTKKRRKTHERIVCEKP